MTLTTIPGELFAGDFHVHSTFSDDAISTLEENVAAAHAAGLTQIRLVDHVRESTTWVPDYVAAVRALAVPPGLTVLTGVETKVRNSDGALDLPALPEGIDRVLIADHQFPSAEGPLTPQVVLERIAAGWAPAEVLDTYVTALIRAMERHPGNQLAHCFSLLPKIGLSETDLSDVQLAAWAQTAALTNTYVEVNEKWACPGPSALAALEVAGATLVASTDSHEAGDVGRYDRARSIVAEHEQAARPHASADQTARPGSAPAAGSAAAPGTESRNA